VSKTSAVISVIAQTLLIAQATANDPVISVIESVASDWSALQKMRPEDRRLYRCRSDLGELVGTAEAEIVSRLGKPSSIARRGSATRAYYSVSGDTTIMVNDGWRIWFEFAYNQYGVVLAAKCQNRPRL
jgi:hypothetical protein